MISFESDYTNGAHPVILQKLIETNDEMLATYGFDKYSESAKEKIDFRIICVFKIFCTKIKKSPDFHQKKLFFGLFYGWRLKKLTNI